MVQKVVTKVVLQLARLSSCALAAHSAAPLRVSPRALCLLLFTGAQTGKGIRAERLYVKSLVTWALTSVGKIILSPLNITFPFFAAIHEGLNVKDALVTSAETAPFHIHHIRTTQPLVGTRRRRTTCRWSNGAGNLSEISSVFFFNRRATPRK